MNFSGWVQDSPYWSYCGLDAHYASKHFGTIKAIPTEIVLCLGCGMRNQHVPSAQAGIHLLLNIEALWNGSFSGLRGYMRSDAMHASNASICLT